MARRFGSLAESSTIRFAAASTSSFGTTAAPAVASVLRISAMPLHSAKQIDRKLVQRAVDCDVGERIKPRAQKKRIGLPVGWLKIGDLVKNGDRSGNARPSDVSSGVCANSPCRSPSAVAGRSRRNETAARTCAVSRQRRRPETDRPPCGERSCRSQARRNRSHGRLAGREIGRRLDRRAVLVLDRRQLRRSLRQDMNTIVGICGLSARTDSRTRSAEKTTSVAHESA